MENEKEKNDTIDYFRSNIFQAKCAYTAWKALYYSKAPKIVGEELAKRYVKIQNYHPYFFSMAERCFLISWVILICHFFDADNRAFSLRKIDVTLFDKFINKNNNKDIINRIKTSRDKIFAHADIGIDRDSVIIVSADEMDIFFNSLENFYNALSNKIDNSVTSFDSSSDIKNQIEQLFMNLERGEGVRLKEIDINWMWSQDNNKISNKI